MRLMYMSLPTGRQSIGAHICFHLFLWLVLLGSAVSKIHSAFASLSDRRVSIGCPTLTCQRIDPVAPSNPP